MTAADVTGIAERACSDDRWVIEAIDARLLRSDAGRVRLPVTWVVVVQFRGLDGPAVLWVDDATGAVLDDDPHRTP